MICQKEAKYNILVAWNTSELSVFFTDGRVTQYCYRLGCCVAAVFHTVFYLVVLTALLLLHKHVQITNVSVTVDTSKLAVTVVTF